jgi:hypothetical protein
MEGARACDREEDDPATGERERQREAPARRCCAPGAGLHAAHGSAVVVVVIVVVVARGGDRREGENASVAAITSKRLKYLLMLLLPSRVCLPGAIIPAGDKTSMRAR